jgi:hypothetical protein
MHILILELQDISHLKKLPVAIDLTWDDNIIYMLIRIQEEFSASIVRKFLVEAMFSLHDTPINYLF